MGANARKILVVEDDRDFEALVLRALQKTEFGDRVVVAHDASEAMGQLLPAGAGDGANGRTAVVFLDLSLPNLDGLELLRCIRSDFAIRSLPVVIFSSSSQTEDIRRAYAEGANSYVHKPVGPEALFETVRLLATYWMTVNEPPPGI
jgi:two-component system response regulator